MPCAWRHSRSGNASRRSRAGPPAWRPDREDERAELVAALDPVDYVVIFVESTADALLRAVRPDVYVKGADYSEATLPEAPTVRQIGAQLMFVELIANRSSSALARAARSRKR